MGHKRNINIIACGVIYICNRITPHPGPYKRWLYYKNNENNFNVECKVFSDIDDGTIDLLSIDIEGGEWYVLKHVVSKPKVISIETHGKFYTNPFLAQIQHWLQNNNYTEWYKDKSDTVYVQHGLFTITIADIILLHFQNIVTSIIKLKRFLRR